MTSLISSHKQRSTTLLDGGVRLSRVAELEQQVAALKVSLAKAEESKNTAVNKWVGRLNKAEDALRRIAAQRANRYESTVPIVCDIADAALAP